jgi:hypothetical protein
MLTAELAWSQPNAAAKHAREQVLVTEARNATNVGDGLIGFDQVSFCRFDADTSDFGCRGAPDESHETLFQGAPGNG